MSDNNTQTTISEEMISSIMDAAQNISIDSTEMRQKDMNKMNQNDPKCPVCGARADNMKLNEFEWELRCPIHGNKPFRGQQYIEQQEIS